jgi:hypothetical protein
VSASFDHKPEERRRVYLRAKRPRSLGEAGGGGGGLLVGGGIWCHTLYAWLSAAKAVKEKPVWGRGLTVMRQAASSGSDD